MHKCEEFLMALDADALDALRVEASNLTDRHVAALKEQFTRLGLI